MTAALAFIVLGATLLATGYAAAVKASNRFGVGIVARQLGNGKMAFLDTQILSPDLFQPNAQDDPCRDYYGIGHWLVPGELLYRYAQIVPSPAAHVKLTGL